MKHSGYVIYPEGSTRHMLRNARKEAVRQSKERVNEFVSRIERIGDEKTIERYWNGYGRKLEAAHA